MKITLEESAPKRVAAKLFILQAVVAITLRG
jgi:hypothetical protein